MILFIFSDNAPRPQTTVTAREWSRKQKCRHADIWEKLVYPILCFFTIALILSGTNNDYDTTN